MAEKAKVLVLLESPQECLATIDQDSLQQVMTNLLANAVQALGEGGTVRVQVTTESSTPPRVQPGVPRAFVRLSVVDDGTGILPQVLPHIFEPFFSTKGAGDGMGLGLSLVYGIVEDHGGFIALASEVGKGSQFSVFLPQASAR